MVSSIHKHRRPRACAVCSSRSKVPSAAQRRKRVRRLAQIRTARAASWSGQLAAALGDAGLSPEDTVRNIFTNYVNEALDVDVEWPLVTPHSRAAV